jgi:hypothetical protein
MEDVKELSEFEISDNDGPAFMSYIFVMANAEVVYNTKLKFLILNRFELKVKIITGQYRNSQTIIMWMSL